MQNDCNILKYYGKFSLNLGGAAPWSVVCTEVCTGSLRDLLYHPTFTTLTEAQRVALFWDIIRQVLTGLKKCHYNNPILMHRDIKLTNGT
jgi:serine/threonine protein kinase